MMSYFNINTFAFLISSLKVDVDTFGPSINACTLGIYINK